MTPRAARLTRAKVLRTAVAIADRNGLEALSMRALGQRLGVEAMSLYNHVDGKDDLLDGIVNLVVSQFVIPPDDEPWRTALGVTAHSVRKVLLRHPWAAALVESRVTPSPERLRYSEGVLKALRGAGFSTEAAFRAQLTLMSFVYGFTLQEVTWPFDPGELGDAAASLAPHVPPEEFPNLTTMMSWLIHDRAPRVAAAETGSLDAEFEFGLDLLLHGLAAIRQQP